MCRDVATELGLDLTFLQSSHEGQIVDWFHELGPLVKSGESIEAVYNPARTRIFVCRPGRHRRPSGPVRRLETQRERRGNGESRNEHD